MNVFLGLTGLDLCYDRLDENLCELLTVSSELAVALAAALVEYEYLVALYEW